MNSCHQSISVCLAIFPLVQSIHFAHFLEGHFMRNFHSFTTQSMSQFMKRSEVSVIGLYLSLLRLLLLFVVLA